MKRDQIIKRVLPAVYIGVVPAAFGIFGKPTEMGMAVVAGCLLAAFLNLELFESFKGGGFEATLRKAVDEAYATIEKLQDVAAALAEPIVVATTMNGRMFQYVPMKSKVEQIQEIEASLLAIGVSEDRASDVTRFFYRAVEHDHVSKLLHHIEQQNDAPASLMTEVATLKEDFVAEVDLQALLNKFEWELTGEGQELLADLETFRKTHKIRRIDTWQ